MGQLFHSPTHVLILLIVVILLFGAPKLPGMARSLGQSMRIFKSEVDGMKNEKKSESSSTSASTSNDVVTGEVIDNGNSTGSTKAE